MVVLGEKDGKVEYRRYPSLNDSSIYNESIDNFFRQTRAVDAAPLAEIVP